MGMMSVLMQLRKVCNHPDLFEPRSVSTSFVMEPIASQYTKCVMNAVEPKPALDRLSPFLYFPLWTIGRGTPSFEQSLSADEVLADQLPAIMTPASTMVQDVKDRHLTEPIPQLDTTDQQGLMSFLSQIHTAEKHENVSRAQFMSGINAQRCIMTTFPYSDRLRKVVAVQSSLLCDLPVRDELTASQIIQCPLELLALRKSQEERANDLDEISEKLVFCVPKATQKRFSIELYSSSTEGPVLTKTLATFDKFFSQFQKAASRLTMCHPDKKLVQFDAGKLQTLATLLRKLKQEGHRVLIFTQMSKMLDVLESFLNLNNHTYLRLDGSVSVDRRQRLMDRFNSDTKLFCFILSTRSGGLGINLTGGTMNTYVQKIAETYTLTFSLLFGLYFLHQLILLFSTIRTGTQVCLTDQSCFFINTNYALFLHKSPQIQLWMHRHRIGGCLQISIVHRIMIYNRP